MYELYVVYCVHGYCVEVCISTFIVVPNRFALTAAGHPPAPWRPWASPPAPARPRRPPVPPTALPPAHPPQPPRAVCRKGALDGTAACCLPVYERPPLAASGWL